MIERTIYQSIYNQCFKGKSILLLGARQVGKTTLLRKLISAMDLPSVWLNADEGDIYASLVKADTSTALLQIMGPNNKLVIIDEAQQIPEIGKKLKLMHDNFPHIQVIATGSSAFELQNQANESLTGRKKEFYLFPLSFDEIRMHTSIREAQRLIDTRLVYGAYPEVLNNVGNEKDVLLELVNSYLYKDILRLDKIRRPSMVHKLLQLIALQVGSEVNYHELAKNIGNVDSGTVEKYLDILEKAYIVFKLSSFSRNMRNEIKKGKKYYFYDNGVRNVIINSFNPPDLRKDKGALWENFLISERLKINSYSKRYCNMYFWRTHDQAEIDYIEEYDGKLAAFEFKWKKSQLKFPASFLSAYPAHSTLLIHNENYLDFIINISNIGHGQK